MIVQDRKDRTTEVEVCVHCEGAKHKAGGMARGCKCLWEERLRAWVQAPGPTCLKEKTSKPTPARCPLTFTPTQWHLCVRTHAHKHTQKPGCKMQVFSCYNFILIFKAWPFRPSGFLARVVHCVVLWTVSSAERGDWRKISLCCFTLLPAWCLWSVQQTWRSVHLQITSLSVSLFCRLEKDSIQQSFSNEAKAQALQAQQREQELTQKIQQMEAQHDKTGGW